MQQGHCTNSHDAGYLYARHCCFCGFGSSNRTEHGCLPIIRNEALEGTMSRRWDFLGFSHVV